MKSERQAHNLLEKDDSNGYRTRKVLGDKQQIELRVPRTREGTFYPVIFGLLKNQERESRTLSFHLYKSGLTTEQIGQTFEEIEGKHYSTSQVRRMFYDARGEVKEWLNRSIDAYYPIVYIDAMTHRQRE